MNDRGKSDSPVVPAKPPNKPGRPGAEVVEGRGLPKGNAASKTRPGRRAGQGETARRRPSCDTGSAAGDSRLLPRRGPAGARYVRSDRRARTRSSPTARLTVASTSAAPTASAARPALSRMRARATRGGGSDPEARKFRKQGAAHRGDQTCLARKAGLSTSPHSKSDCRVLEAVVSDLVSAQSKAERPSRATPASEICGAGIRGPCIHFKRGTCAGRHGDGRTVDGEMPEEQGRCTWPGCPCFRSGAGAAQPPSARLHRPIVYVTSRLIVFVNAG